MFLRREPASRCRRRVRRRTHLHYSPCPGPAGVAPHHPVHSLSPDSQVLAPGSQVVRAPSDLPAPIYPHTAAINRLGIERRTALRPLEHQEPASRRTRIHAPGPPPPYATGMNPIPMEGRVALVTGASRGIGAASAQALDRAGARVVLVARSGDALSQIARQLHHDPVVLVADLRDPGAPGLVAQPALDAVGTVDVLVNNAAVAARLDTVDTDAGIDRSHAGGQRPGTAPAHRSPRSGDGPARFGIDRQSLVGIQPGRYTTARRLRGIEEEASMPRPGPSPSNSVRPGSGSTRLLPGWSTPPCGPGTRRYPAWSRRSSARRPSADGPGRMTLPTSLSSWRRTRPASSPARSSPPMAGWREPSTCSAGKREKSAGVGTEGIAAHRHVTVRCHGAAAAGSFRTLRCTCSPVVTRRSDSAR